MIVRQFEKVDARACCQVINACIASTQNLDAPTRFYMQSENIPSDFLLDIKGDYALVAELHGQIVGFAALQDSEIHRIYVSPDFQGNGIGETLIISLEAEALARGVETLNLQAPSSSIDFYQHMGYKLRSKSHTKIGYATVEVINMSKKIIKQAGV